VSNELFQSDYKGKLGIAHLPRVYSKIKQDLHGKRKKIDKNEWTQDLIVLDTLNLGTYEPLEFICSTNASLEEFENWILEKNGGMIEKSVIDKINRAILSDVSEDFTPIKTVLTEHDLEFFDAYGYVIVKNAISKEDCQNTISAIEEFIGLDLSIPANWYKINSGFWIKMYHHVALKQNRESEKIKIAYQQLLHSSNLFNSHDRVSINPPETDSFKYRGSKLHWDVSLDTPMHFGLQGLLYLTDVKENGGAFSCVPGIHKKIDLWLEQFEDKSQARDFDLHSLGVKHISANAGDFIIWDDRLPHGATPNRDTTPRIVQYINFYSPNKNYSDNWK